MGISLYNLKTQQGIARENYKNDNIELPHISG
jgi:hypothetical protein